MSTEIGQLTSVQAMAPQERERVSRGAGDAGGTRVASAAKGAVDEVRLSSSALKLRETGQILAQQSDVDLARVTAIRNALSEGTYQVDAGVLADGLMAQERLFAAGRGL
jgi:negative regulator of flagellin synthesis FlgM